MRALVSGRSAGLAWATAIGRVRDAVFGIVFGAVLGMSATTPGYCAEEMDPAGFAPNPASFGELLEGFSRMTGLEARFEEEKFLALLAAPLRSRGRLYFAPPATLLRRVESPSRQEILIRENQVRISSVGSGGADRAPAVQTIDLRARGGIRPLVESMIWIFTGDRASLERVYDIDYQRFSGDAAQDMDRPAARPSSGPWQIRLTPKTAPLSDLIRELRVSGRGRGADTMELIETSGDRTVTHILDADPDRTFSPAERLELFGDSD